MPGNSRLILFMSLFLKSILSGIFISIGCCLYISCNNPLIGSFAFSIGLLAVVIFQTNLYTGMVGNLIINKNKFAFLKRLLFVFIGNCIGAYLMNILVSYCELNYLKDIGESLAIIKYNKTNLSLLFQGIGCGMLMYIAVTGFKIGKDYLAKTLLLILSVAAFILIGFEHSVADAFYFSFSLKLEAIYKLLIIAFGNMIGSNIISFLHNK